MSYRFPHVEHRLYPLTFLDRASAQIHFDADLSSNMELLRRFFKDNYELEFEEEQLTLMRFKTLKVRSHSADLQLKFSLDFFEVIIGRESYTSFQESIMPHLAAFIKLIDAMRGKIYKASVRKINSWKFLKFPGLAYHSLVESVISPILAKDFPRDPEPPIEADEELIITTFITDNRYENQALKINFGYSPHPEEDVLSNQTPVRVILDTECVSLDANALHNNNVIKTLTEANQMLFDLYHWAVMPEIIEAMQH
ncbi:MAG: hypothetical protein K2M87_02050 [Muribaculaceae bacterium]|nr:hypothetical protein [Muribaculaceae bacterium]